MSRTRSRVMQLFRITAFALVFLCFSMVLAQQKDDTCSTFVEDALDTVANQCAALGRNQACYGNNQLQATPRESAVNFTFSEPGDITNVIDLQSLRLRQLDLQDNIWGIALMKIQANLPDALPGQNVTFVLFGDVEIENAVAPAADAATLEVTSTGNINIRNRPSTNAAVLGSLKSGEVVTANGRNEDSSWLRIELPDGSSLGWVFANLVTPDGDVSTLSVVDPDDAEIPLNPMQAFYLTTGVTGTNCTQAPESGILIQTPGGAGEITLRVNDVDIELGSSAYFQAPPGEIMTISVVEGEGRATAMGESVVIPAGSQVEIPLDENQHATGAPSDATPYDDASLQTLPLQLLPEPITVAPPMEEDSHEMPGGEGGFSGSLPGGLDPSLFNSGFDTAMFCGLITQSFASAGMTISEYIAMIQQYKGLIPAESQADFDELIVMLQACQ